MNPLLMLMAKNSQEQSNLNKTQGMNRYHPDFYRTYHPTSQPKDIRMMQELPDLNKGTPDEIPVPEGWGPEMKEAQMFVPEMGNMMEPEMGGSDPSMDYNSLMLNPPPYSRGIAGNITSTEDIAPHDYDALVRQRQAQNLIDNPDMDEWDTDFRRTAQLRRNKYKARAEERRLAARQRVSDRREAREDRRNSASNRRELARMAAAENRAAAKIRKLTRMPAYEMPTEITSAFAPQRIEQVPVPQVPRDRWRDNRGLFQGGREGRLFGRTRDWVEDRY
jgi:hypothetical protein